MSSGLDWERFGVITGGDEVCILPPPTLSEKGVGIPTSVYFPYLFPRLLKADGPHYYHPVNINTVPVFKEKSERT